LSCAQSHSNSCLPAPGARLARLTGAVWTPTRCLPRARVELEGERIARVEEKISPPRTENAPAADELRADPARFVIAPGLIDSHMHGAGGGDLFYGGVEAVDRLRGAAARGGAASLVTVLPYFTDDTDCRQFRAALEAARASAAPGARLLGIHLETPFINPVKRGGFPARCCHPADLALFRRLAGLAGDWLRVLTLAPELPGAEGILREALARGARVSLGHSDAGAALAERFFDLGANRLTHVFNAMNPLHHREVGLLGAALLDPRVFIEVIPDGRHVEDRALRLLARLVEPERLVAITDGNAGSGLAEGALVRAVGGEARLRDGATRLADGTLAGSAILADGALRGLIERADLPPRAALECLTLTPARSLGLENEIGSIQPGRRADFTLLERGSWRARLTISGGVVIAASESSEGEARR